MGTYCLRTHALVVAKQQDFPVFSPQLVVHDVSDCGIGLLADSLVIWSLRLQCLGDLCVPRKPLTQSEAIQKLTARANDGIPSAVDALRKLLDQHPELWHSVGDLGAFAERAWIDLVAGGNKLVEQASTRRLNELKAQLAGSNPTTLETLVSDLVALNWLVVQEANMAAANPPGKNLPLATYRLRRAESAQRRFASATRSLATLRALLPRGGSAEMGSAT